MEDYNKLECPKCGEKMEHKFSLDDGTDDGEWKTKIYQCQICKNIEAI